LIGSLLNFFFFGILLVQVCAPLPSCSTSCRIFSFVVYFIFFALTACLCLNAADVQFWFGTHFGDIESFLHPRHLWFYTPIMGSVIATLVQLFFCYRI
ncbi:hypothetical protein B0H19DRAFT_846099, partial [Mycena capillaripes]